MTKYLIVKCKELGDQFECDADREPMFLVDDWGEWFNKNHPTYQFEVYKYMDDDHEEVAPTVVAHYKNYDRKKKVPDKVWKIFRQGAYWADGDEFTEKDFKNDLRSCGYVSWDDKEHKKYWVYGYYADGRYCLGY